MLPAVVVDHHTGRVQGFGSKHHCVAMGLLGLIRLHVPHAPGFIHRCPNHDAGMVVIPRNCLDPLGMDPADILLGIDIGRADLAPHQQTHPVRVVQIPGVFHLLVLTHAIKAHSLGQLDVPNEGFIGGSGHQRFLPIALVQHQFLIVLTVVEHKLPVFDAHLTHTEIGIHHIGYALLAPKADAYIKQAGIFRGPGHIVLPHLR